MISGATVSVWLVPERKRGQPKLFMMLNLDRPFLQPGRYWVCDPTLVFEEGHELHAAFKAQEIMPGFWSCDPKLGDFRVAFVYLDWGNGCFGFEHAFDGAAEVMSGYLGVFPDELIRKMKKITKMKVHGRSNGAIEVVMDNEFAVSHEDYGMEIGPHRLSKYLAE